MAFSADVLEYPLKIASIGTLYKEHIDIDSVTALKYSNNKTAAITVSALTELSMRSTVYGTNGTIVFEPPFVNPNKIIVKGQVFDFPYEIPPVKMDYGDMMGMKYEAEEVRRCINLGLWKVRLCLMN